MVMSRWPALHPGNFMVNNMKSTKSAWPNISIDPLAYHICYTHKGNGVDSHCPRSLAVPKF